VSGRDRDQVYPDEVASVAARAVAFALFAGLVGGSLLRRRPPFDVAETAVGAFLLLSPTLHPWYVLGLVPLVAVRPRPAWLALVALVPLAYLPGDRAWTRALEHGLPIVLLLGGELTARRRAVT
jgi:hypothetical protein